MIGVMLHVEGEPGPVRRFFAVGEGEQARAEWRAVDAAITEGSVAVSPFKGLEPVHAVAELTAARVALMGLRSGEVRALGWRWPRRWLGTFS